MYVLFDFDPEVEDDVTKRRLALIAATTCGFAIESLSLREFAVRIASAEDAYRLGVEHGRLLFEHERNKSCER